jgi:hypothetical protein
MPLFRSLAGYDRTWLRGDLLAGMTVWAVLVPEALAYDVSAARMLVPLTGDLRRSGVELVIARDVGQVRDVLRRAETDTPLPRAHPTVREAVEAVSGPESPGPG